ncbi:MAG: 30S ribosomal protein S13 [Patescibacteria group bacterium]
MMRILGITLKEEQRIEIALTGLYGIGRSRAGKIISEAKIDPGTKSKNLTTEEEVRIRTLIEGFKLEGDLRRIVGGNIKRLKDIKAYRGIRHARHLPARGQRTKSNSRTVRGNVRKTMGSGRRKTEKT